MSDREDALRLAMEADPFEKIIDRYVDDYTLEGDDGTHTPTHEEKILIKDAIIGLLVDPDWDTEWGKHIDQLCRDKFAGKDWEVPAAKLVEWLYCMSYNDSYFGEPAGLVKRATAELNRLLPSMPIIAEPAPTEGATPTLPDLESEAYYFPPSAEPFFDADQMRKCAKDFARTLYRHPTVPEPISWSEEKCDRCEKTVLFRLNVSAAPSLPGSGSRSWRRMQRGGSD